MLANYVIETTAAYHHRMVKDSRSVCYHRHSMWNRAFDQSLYIQKVCLRRMLSDCRSNNLILTVRLSH